jgi:hypothetical protein
MVSVAQRIRRRAPLKAALGMAAAAAFAASATVARAGEYHVYSCRTPAGEAAPADGWSGSVAPRSAPDVYVKNTCGEGGALVAGLGEQAIHISYTDMVSWIFEAPSTETISNATLWRAGYLHGAPGEQASYQFWLAGPVNTKAFDECVYSLECHAAGDPTQPLSLSNRVAVPSANLGARLYVNASCGEGMPGNACRVGFADPNGNTAVVNLYAADITLEQTGGPTAGNVSGELATAPAVRGTSDILFSATDGGSGVYEAVFSVDGQAVQASVVNEDGGRCRDVGQTTDGRAAFLYVQPCLASVSADVGFDTTRVGNGPHRLLVTVIDAAGNAAPVLDREITVANPPGVGPPNGTNASAQATLMTRWKGTSRASVTSGYGRSRTVLGRLTAPGGGPISGALIDVSATPAFQGSKPITLASAHTGADGSFSVRVGGSASSSTLRFAYRSHLGDSPPAATSTLTLRVRAGVALAVAPRTASVGRSIFFRGRLLGGPIPRDGKQLVLEARSPGSPWIEFEVVRANARGRFRASYRFKFAGPAEYQFRVVSEAESDYPFAAGASNVVRVSER